MPDTIKIQNCNNIMSGEIEICADKLNILFGRNGTGKSTIARAIYLASQNKPLTELTPYGSVSEDDPPSIEGVEPGGVTYLTITTSVSMSINLTRLLRTLLKFLFAQESMMRQRKILTML